MFVGNVYVVEGDEVVFVEVMYVVVMVNLYEKMFWLELGCDFILDWGRFQVLWINC